MHVLGYVCNELFALRNCYSTKTKQLLDIVVESLSHVQLFATPWTAAHQASLSITISWSLLKLMSIKSVMPRNHRILCRPLLLPSSVFPSIIRVFSNELGLSIRWPKYWSFSFSISPSSKYSALISFIVIQSLSPVRFFATPRTAACQASLSFTVSWSLLKLPLSQ